MDISNTAQEYSLEIVQVSEKEFSLEFTFVVGSGGGGTSLTAQTLGDTIAAATVITEPSDAATVAISDPDDLTNPDIAKSFSWGSIKTFLIASFNLLYAAVGHNHDSDYAARSHNHDLTYAALNHNHAGTYDPAGTAASAVGTHEGSLPHYSALASMSDDSTHRLVTDTEKSTWNGKAEGNHNHTGVYDPAGTAAGSMSTHEGAFSHKTKYQIWDTIISVSRTGDTVISYTAATEAAATLMANSIGGLIAKWTSSDGNTTKRGFIRNATAVTTTVTINLQGDAFASDDINFRLAMAERIKKHQVMIPGELTADAATDTGFELMTTTGEDIRALASSAFVKVAAAGASADLQYDWFDDGTGLMTTDPTFTTNTSVLNSIINNQVVAGGSRLSLRIIVSAGATNKAATLNAILYYCNDDLFDAV